MNPIEALQILDNVCSQVSLNREAHAKIQQAVGVLKMAIIPVTKPVDKKE